MQSGGTSPRLIISVLTAVLLTLIACDRLITEIDPPPPLPPLPLPSGTTLMVAPESLTGGIGGEIEFGILVDNVDSLMLVKAVILFDMSVLNMHSWTEGTFLESHSGTELSVVEWSNSSGRLVLNLAAVEGNPLGVQGGGTLLKITFTGIASGESLIRFDSSETELRNTENNPIPIDNLLSAVCKVR